MGIKENHGNYFCSMHSKYHTINSNKLEVIVLMRFEGKTPKEIEEKLDKLLWVNIKIKGEINMLIHNKVYNHRKKQQRIIERKKLAKKVKPKEKHVYCGNWGLN